MTKKSVLIHKLWRAYNKKENWEHSKFKGYPENTYYGYTSFVAMKTDVLKEFISFYGKGLKKFRIKIV